MELNDAVWLIIAGWGVLMLILWNLHRYAGLFSRVQYLLTVIAFTAVAAGMGWYWQRRPRAADIPPRIAVLPTLMQTQSGERLTPRALALTDRLIRRLRNSLDDRYLVAPVQWLFEPANPDSVENPRYWLELAGRLDYPLMLQGRLGQDGSFWRLSLRLLAAGRANPLWEGVIESRRDRFDALSLDAAAEIHRVLSKTPFQVAPTDVMPLELYRVWLKILLRRRDAERSVREAVQRYAKSPAAWSLYAAWLLQNPRLVELDLKHREVLLGEAGEKLAEFSDSDTTNADLARLAAELFIWREKFNEAAVYALRAYRHAQWDSRVVSLLARLHYTRYRPLGFFNEEDIYRRALLLNPGDVQARLELAAVEMQLYKTVEAQQLLEDALRINPNHLQILRALGQIYVSRGLARRIFATYQKILELRPRDPDAFYNLGIYYYHSGDDSTAERFFLRAVELGDHRDSRLYLAKIAEKRGDLQRAIHYLRERIRLKTGDNDVFAEEARRHLFDIMLALGKVDSTGRILQTNNDSR